MLTSLFDGPVEAPRDDTRGAFTLTDPEAIEILGGRRSATGIRVNEHKALTYSAFWAAINFISSQVAMLPFVLFKREGRERIRYTEHPLYRLLHDEPNSEMSSLTLRQTLTAHCLSWGNGYAEIERDVMGRPLALWPLTPDRVTPIRVPEGLPLSGELVYRVTQDDGRQPLLRQSQMLHLHGLGWDGTQGYSIVRMAMEAIAAGLALEKFGGAFFGNGAAFSGVLSHPSKMKDNGKWLREQINQKHVGLDRAFRMLILQEGMSYTKLGTDPESAQFLQSREFSVTEIARWFNLPVHKLRVNSQTTSYASLEVENTSVLNDALMFWLRVWEFEANRKLIPTHEKNRQFIEHVTDGFLRGDSAARGAFYQQLMGLGALTPNGICERENLPLAGPEGDERFISTGFQPIKRLLQEPEPEPEQEPEDTEESPEEGQDDSGVSSDEGQDASVEQARSARLLLATRSVVADALGRLLYRHQQRLEKSDTFDAESEREYITTQLRPSVAAVAAVRSVELSEALDPLVTRYLAEWRTAEASAMADAWMGDLR